MAVYMKVLVGSQVSDKALVAAGVDLETTDEIDRCPALGNCAVVRDPHGDGWSYVTCYLRTFLPSAGSEFQVPTLIYGSLIEDVEQTIQPILTEIGLWNPNQFGVWMFGGDG